MPVSKRKMTKEDREYQSGIVDAIESATNRNIVISHIARVLRMAQHGIVPDTRAFWGPISKAVRRKYSKYVTKMIEQRAHLINRRREMGSMGRRWQ